MCVWGFFVWCVCGVTWCTVKKSPAEIMRLESQKRKTNELKTQRRLQQEANVRKKKEVKKEAIAKKIEERKQKQVENLLSQFHTDTKNVNETNANNDTNVSNSTTTPTTTTTSDAQVQQNNTKKEGHESR